MLFDVFCLWLFFAVCVAAGDCETVVALWKSLGKDTAVDPSNPTECCTGIDGITCDGPNVIGLNWQFKTIVGSIPSDIGKLTNLEHLWLSNTNLEGSIPHEIGNLVNLKSLKLAETNLDGVIPDSIGNLVGLENLDLRHNQLIGKIPAEIGSLENLVLLNLGYNKLSGPIPAVIVSLEKLVVLGLEENDLTGCIPCDLDSLSFEEFGIFGNEFETNCADSRTIMGTEYACDDPQVSSVASEQDDVSSTVDVFYSMTLDGDVSSTVTSEEDVSLASSSMPTTFTQTVTVKVSCSTVVEPKVTVSCSTAVESKTSVHDGAVSTYYVTKTLSDSQDDDRLIVGSTSKVSWSMSVLLCLVFFLI